MKEGLCMINLKGTRNFQSDNSSSVHTKIMEAMLKVNSGHEPAYGYDEVTKYADILFDRAFGHKVYVFYTINGTGTNSAAIAHFTRSGEEVLCSDMAHILCTESGAVERLSGAKLTPLKSDGGIISSETLEVYLSNPVSEHTRIPRMLSITQTTEAGKVYKPIEIQRLCDVAHRYGLKVHMDGSRIANAVVSLGCSLYDATFGAGIDIISFGGAKNGLMFGEAVIFKNADDAYYFRNTRKSCGQLFSKMRFISAQFAASLEDDLWLEMAKNANDMTDYLYSKMRECPDCFTIYEKPEANELYAFVNPLIKDRLIEKIPFFNFGPVEGASRFVCSFDTEKEDIDELISNAVALLAMNK